MTLTARQALAPTRAGDCILDAFDTPLNGGGAAMAVRFVRELVATTLKTGPIASGTAWLDEVTAMHARALAMLRQYPRLDAAPDSTDLGIYELFAGRSTCKLSEASRAGLDHAMGALLLAQFSANASGAKNRALSPRCVTTWWKLRAWGVRGARTNPEFALLAEDFPGTVEEIDATLEGSIPDRERIRHQGLRDLLRDVRAALSSIVVAPPTALAEADLPDPARGDGDGSMSDDEDDEDDEYEDDDECDDGDANSSTANEQSRGSTEIEWEGSLVVWQLKRADHFDGRLRLNASDRWDSSALEGFRKSCRTHRANLTSDDSELRAFALTALCSVPSALPGRLAIRLRLRRNGDMWLDLQRKAVRWNLARVKDWKGKDLVGPRLPDPESDLVDVYLDDLAAKQLLLLHAERPDAASLDDLVGVPKDLFERKRWLKRYRKYLRTVGDEGHLCLDGRLARGFGEFFRQSMRSDVLAGLLGLDFASTSLATFHYLAIPARLLHELQAKAYQDLGLEIAPLVDAERIIGSQRALDVARFVNGWRLHQQKCQRLLRKLRGAKTLSQLFTAFNAIIVERLLRILTAEAGRGNHLDRQTNHALFLHDDLVALSDRDVNEEVVWRLIPKHRLLAGEIKALRNELRLLRDGARRFGVPESRLPLDQLLSLGSEVPAFFKIEPARTPGGTFRLVPIERPEIEAAALESFGVEARNLGRHFLVSQLICRGVDPVLVRILTGHVRGKVEHFCDAWALPASLELRQLAAAVDGLFADIDLTERDAASGSEYVISRGIGGTLPSASGDPYAEPREAPSGKVLPRAFDRYSLLAISLVGSVRRGLSAGGGPEADQASALAHMLVFDGLSYPEVERVWKAKLSGLAGLAAVPLYCFERPGCFNEIAFPLCPPTRDAVQRMLASGKKIDLSASVRDLASWLKSEFPNFGWSVDPVDVVRTFGALVERWLRYVLSSPIHTAASRAIDAATPNPHSLLRLAREQDEVDMRDLAAPALGARHRTVKLVEGALKSLIAKVHKYGDSRRRLGENLKRAQDLEGEIAPINCGGSPSAKLYKRYVNLETAKIILGAPDAIDVASMSTYTSRYAPPCLYGLGPGDKLADFDDEQWDEVTEPLLPGKGSAKEERKKAEARVAMRRFLKVLKEDGFKFPHGLLKEGEAAGLRSARNAASSTLILTRDRSRYRLLARRHFEKWEFAAERCELLIDLFECGLRGGEVGAMRRCRVDALSDFFEVTTEGFSHLKTYFSRRLIKAHQALARALRKIPKSAAGDPSKTDFLFLADEGDDWSTFDLLAEALLTALVQSTGTRAVRLHSMRGAAFCDDAFPGWEQMCRRLLQGTITTQECLDWMSTRASLGRSHFATCMVRIGHVRCATSALYYMAPWPLIRACELRATLADFQPGPARLKARNLYDAFRQSRTRRDSWLWLQQHLPAIELREFVSDSDKSRSAVVPRDVEDGGSSNQRVDQIRYAVLRILDPDPRRASAHAHEFHLETTLAKRIDARLPVEEALVALTKRRKGKRGGRAVRADKKLATSDLASRLVGALMETDRERIAELSAAVEADPRDPSVGVTNVNAPEMLAWILNCLPPSMAIVATFGIGYLTPEVEIKLAGLSPRLKTMPNDRDLKTTRGRLLVTDFPAASNPVRAARLTALVRVAAAATHLINQLSEGNHEA